MFMLLQIAINRQNQPQSVRWLASCRQCGFNVGLGTSSLSDVIQVRELCGDMVGTHNTISLHLELTVHKICD